MKENPLGHLEYMSSGGVYMGGIGESMNPVASPSDPHPDRGQDESYGRARLAHEWNGPPIGVAALMPRLENPKSLFVTGIVSAAAHHVSLQFWNGLDLFAFGAVLLTFLSLALSYRKADDTRYGGLYSIVSILAAALVLGRMVAVYANLYPTSLPLFAKWAIETAQTGSRLDGWMIFCSRAILEWALSLILIYASVRKDPPVAAPPPEPPSIWHDHWPVPKSINGPDVSFGQIFFGLASFAIPIIAPATFTYVDIVLLLFAATMANTILDYVLSAEIVDYGMASVQQPEVTYAWFHPYSFRRYLALEFIGVAAIRAGLPALAAALSAIILGRYWLGGPIVILAYWVTASLMAPNGSGSMFSRMLLIFRHYPAREEMPGAIGMHRMGEPVDNPSMRNSLVFFGAATAAISVYSLQCLIPTWPDVGRYLFAVTDYRPMAWTAIAMSILFQGFGTALFARGTFIATYGKIVHERFNMGDES